MTASRGFGGAGGSINAVEAERAGHPTCLTAECCFHC